MSETDYTATREVSTKILNITRNYNSVSGSLDRGNLLFVRLDASKQYAFASLGAVEKLIVYGEPARAVGCTTVFVPISTTTSWR